MKKERSFALIHKGLYLIIAVPANWDSRSATDKQEYIANLKKNAAKGQYGTGTSAIENYKRNHDLIMI